MSRERRGERHSPASSWPRPVGSLAWARCRRPAHSERQPRETLPACSWLPLRVGLGWAGASRRRCLPRCWSSVQLSSPQWHPQHSPLRSPLVSRRPLPHRPHHAPSSSRPERPHLRSVRSHLSHLTTTSRGTCPRRSGASAAGQPSDPTRRRRAVLRAQHS